LFEWGEEGGARSGAPAGIFGQAQTDPLEQRRPGRAVSPALPTIPLPVAAAESNNSTEGESLEASAPEFSRAEPSSHHGRSPDVWTNARKPRGALWQYEHAFNV